MYGHLVYRRHGFTLAEMSIVLVVIGLIAGAIFVANALIRASDLRSVVSDLARFRQAIGDFQTKYGSLPGDMYNAESFWGSDVSCPATPTNTVPKTATCNGNGDGYISAAGSPGSLAPTVGSPGAVTDYELFRAWQHLADAGMIDGAYTGVPGPGGTAEHDPGINCPRSKLGGGYDIQFMGPFVGNPGWFDGDYGTKIGVGAQRIPFGVDNPLFTPAEALSIDTKLDDGLPGTGNIRPFKNAVTPNCTTSDIPATSQYNTSDSGINCSLIFLNVGVNGI
jgi:prepilin-type N-terminal cleavage/methylation domain-containing protein